MRPADKAAVALSATCLKDAPAGVPSVPSVLRLSTAGSEATAGVTAQDGWLRAESFNVPPVKKTRSRGRRSWEKKVTRIVKWLVNHCSLVSRDAFIHPKVTGC